MTRATRKAKTKLKKLGKEYKKSMAAAKKFAGLYNKFHAKDETRKAKKYQNKEHRCHKKCKSISAKIAKIQKRLAKK